jgi:hypothetical protein
VRYTVWSRGRPIGETDLGFRRLINESRSGWFHPNAEGERLMPVIASVLPAMRAYLHRDAVDAQGDSLVQPGLHGSTLFADLAEAFQHLISLDLELRREDGSVVPASDIGIQDTEQLIELAALDDDDEEVDAGDWDLDDDPLETDEYDLQLEMDVMRDLELIEEALGARADDSCPDWAPDDLEEPQRPRY